MTMREITAQVSATADIPVCLVQDVLDALSGMGVDLATLVKIDP